MGIRGLKIVTGTKVSEKERDIGSFSLLKKSLKNSKDFELALKSVVSYLEDKDGLSPKEIIEIINESEEQNKFPACIFNERLSSLESIVKYLKENLGLKYSEIAKLTNRDDRTIWTTYSNSRKKFPKKFVVKKKKILIPVSIISNRSFSVLFAIVSYLKDDCHLKYSQISVILHRDQRTVWTVYNRHKKDGVRKKAR